MVVCNFKKKINNKQYDCNYVKGYSKPILIGTHCCNESICHLIKRFNSYTFSISFFCLVNISFHCTCTMVYLTIYVCSFCLQRLLVTVSGLVFGWLREAAG